MNSSAPSHGFLDVRATESELTANFTPTRGTYTDSFVIRRGTPPPPPPNQPPSASFTSSTQGLTATVDASGSHDSDGQVRGYAWDFGDGLTGTGVQVQHTYAAAGTYTIRLTVTDDDGATGTASRNVSVSATTTPVDFAADAFNCSVTNGWGTADVGGAWSVIGTASNLSVTPGAASARTTAGATHGAWLGTNTSTDTDLRLTLSPAIVANGSTYVTITGRRVATNNEYAGKLVFTSSGRINVSLIAFRGNATESVIASAVQLPITYAAGTQVNVRLQVTGTSPTTLRLKVWPAGTAEPSTWQRTGTDTGTTLQSAGGVGVRVYLSSAATNGPQVMRVSALSARPTA